VDAYSVISFEKWKMETGCRSCPVGTEYWLHVEMKDRLEIMDALFDQATAASSTSRKTCAELCQLYGGGWCTTAGSMVENQLVFTDSPAVCGESNAGFALGPRQQTPLQKQFGWPYSLGRHCHLDASYSCILFHQ
jgi:hypothetical protein